MKLERADFWWLTTFLWLWCIVLGLIAKYYIRFIYQGNVIKLKYDLIEVIVDTIRRNFSTAQIAFIFLAIGIQLGLILWYKGNKY